MGQDIDVSNQDLDSTRSGILYLSETYSKISKDHEQFKETITAVKISGDKQALTFNSAADAEFNFYQNSVNLDNDLISPIGEMAFSFYRYKLLGTFYTDEGKLINQIEVNRKIDSSPTFQDYLHCRGRLEFLWIGIAIGTKAKFNFNNRFIHRKTKL